jgi:hypothetical protein
MVINTWMNKWPHIQKGMVMEREREINKWTKKQINSHTHTHIYICACRSMKIQDTYARPCTHRCLDTETQYADVSLGKVSSLSAALERPDPEIGWSLGWLEFKDSEVEGSAYKSNPIWIYWTLQKPFHLRVRNQVFPIDFPYFSLIPCVSNI